MARICDQNIGRAKIHRVAALNSLAAARLAALARPMIAVLAFPRKTQQTGARARRLVGIALGRLAHVRRFKRIKL